MTNEEAIRCFKKWSNEEPFIESYILAISALEKQIPKKLKITASTKRCASCNRQISGIGNIHPRRNYCTRCGQKLDWGEGE